MRLWLDWSSELLLGFRDNTQSCFRLSKESLQVKPPSNLESQSTQTQLSDTQILKSSDMALHVRCNGVSRTASCRISPISSHVCLKRPGGASNDSPAKLRSSSSLQLHRSIPQQARALRRRTASIFVTPALPPHATFEPHLDPSALAAQLLVLTVTVGAAAYW